MRLAIKLILGGIPSVVIGVIWLIYGLNGGDPNGVFTGGIWKGPLLMSAGVGAVIMGIRMIREESAPSQQ